MQIPTLLISCCLIAADVTAQGISSLLSDFQQAKGRMKDAVVQQSSGNESTKIVDFTIMNDRDDTLHGRLRMPTAVDGKFPVALLIVGIETGKEVVEMIRGHEDVIVVGLDYPFEGPYDFSGWSTIKAAFSLRETGFMMVPRILLCLDWLFGQSNVDTTDVTLVAVSFGVFTALPAAVIDRRIRRVAVVQAGGNLSEIIGANARRLDAPIPPWLAGWLGSWMLAPFEPNRYIGRISPRPVFLVSGESDEFFPHASVKSLFDHAGDPKEWIRHKRGHVMPGERELIVELTNILAERLYGAK
jgi:hypothetical protein